MNAPNFTSILDKPATQIERPKPIPVGQYLTLLQGMPRHDKSSKKQTPFVEFTHKFMSVHSDVNEEELEAFLTAGDGTKKNLQDVTRPSTFYLTEGSAFMLKEFMEKLDEEFKTRLDAGEPMRPMLDETPGKMIIVTIRHEATQDGQGVQARIGGFASVE